MPKVKLIGVDPVGSLYYDFVKSGRITKPFSYKVEGIGEDFFPTTMNLKIMDDIVRVDDKECFTMTRELTHKEGLFVGGSGGAAVAGAIKYAAKLKKPEKIIVFLCDSGQKYVSKIFNDDWMRENGFMDDQPGLGTVHDLLGARAKTKIVTAQPSSKVRDVIATLKSLGISQLPVVDKGKLVGIVGEIDLLRHLVSGSKTLDSRIAELIEGDYATVTSDTKIELLQGVLADAKAAIVEDGHRVTGIVTKIDLIDYLAKRKPETLPTRSTEKSAKSATKSAPKSDSKSDSKSAVSKKKTASPSAKSSKASARA